MKLLGFTIVSTQEKKDALICKEFLERVDLIRRNLAALRNLHAVD